MSAADQAAPALTLNAVSYTTSSQISLVSDISFTVDSGEIAAIVGPNGAGKTTLIRMIAGLAKPTSGRIMIDGKSICDLSFAERANKIAYVGQSDEPDGRLTLAQYVALGFLPHARLFSRDGGIRQSLDALEIVGLSHLAERRMDVLSGGEKQKAKVARAMCQRPTLLVLDEPTNHLDPQARGELLGIVTNMGIPIIAVLHDLTLIDAFADKVAIIENGCLQAYGVPQDVLTTTDVRNVFGVDMHRLAHPTQNHTIPTLDIKIAAPMAH